MKRPVPNPGVLRVPDYFQGASQGEGAIKLSSNENAYGPSPKAVAAIRAAAVEAHRYPEGPAMELGAAIGRFWGLDPGRILTATGSDDLIMILTRAYLAPGDAALVFADSFPKYRSNIIGAEGEAVTVRRDKDRDFAIDPDDVLAVLTPRTRIVFLDNPCNPTGTALDRQALAALHARLPDDVILALDEAYAEFTDWDGAGFRLADRAENVVVFRTFSKAFALAGMRVGWCYGPAGIIAAMSRIRPTFPITIPSAAAAMAALEDREHLTASVAAIRRTRESVAARLRAAGWRIPAAEGNFLLLRADAARVEEAERRLAEAGVLVRPMVIQGGERCLRITVGTDADMDVVERALEGKPA